MRALILMIVLLSASLPALAADYAFPLVCEPNVSCFVLSYPDLDAAPNQARDYTCGTTTQDGDNMVRFGLSNIAQVPTGVPVLAAADGTVIETLDGLPDLYLKARAQLKKGTPACGNAIIIDHGKGERSAYCHLLDKSLQVKKGDRVVRGQIIAAVGQSGLAFWPQLGFSIMKRGLFVDPMSGASTIEGCGIPPRPLLDLPDAFKTYAPFVITDIGFATDVPSSDIVRRGLAPRLSAAPRTSSNIVLWGYTLNLQAGDTLNVRVLDTEGRTLASASARFKEAQSEFPVLFPVAPAQTRWKPGIYTGEITLERTHTPTFKTDKTVRQVTINIE